MGIVRNHREKGGFSGRHAVGFLLCLLMPSCGILARASDLASDNARRSAGLGMPDSAPPLAETRPTSETYREQALRLILREANQVAQQLKLPDRLPITEKDLVEKYITPPAISRELEAIGTVTTSNYVYCVSVGNKFSYVIGKHQLEDCVKWEKDYLWPMSRLDTNGAYQLATQWLSAVSMDVKALNRDYRLFIDPDNIYVRPPPGKFVPVYWVGWYKKFTPTPGIHYSHKSEWEPVASVFLFAPTKTLLQLRVEDPKYILRKPLQFTNLDSSFREPKR